MEVIPKGREARGDTVRISAEVRGAGNQEPDVLWAEVPSGAQDLLSPTDDFLAVAALFAAMRAGEELRVRGRVTASLLENLDEFQAAWCQWRPERYTRVRVVADEEVADRTGPDTRSAIQTFSGGVDSAFTTVHHLDRLAGRGSLELSAAVLIHGFDIPLDDHRAYQALYERSVPLLRARGVELIPVATNFRELWHSDLSHWEDAFGTGMAMVLTLFADRFEHGIIASSEPYGSLLLPWGSNPVTDPLLSGGRMRVHHDAAGTDRNTKVAELSRLWPEGADNLRVCWQGENKERNCCRCEKCIRTILNFRVSGSPVPAAFPHEVTSDHIRGLRGLSEAHVNPLRQIREAALASGNRAEWVEALGECIFANEAEIAEGVTYEGGFPLLVSQ